MSVGARVGLAVLAGVFIFVFSYLVNGGTL